jgi:hypothetical protein
MSSFGLFFQIPLTVQCPLHERLIFEKPFLPLKGGCEESLPSAPSWSASWVTRMTIPQSKVTVFLAKVFLAKVFLAKAKPHKVKDKLHKVKVKPHEAKAKPYKVKDKPHKVKDKLHKAKAKPRKVKDKLHKAKAKAISKVKAGWIPSRDPRRRDRRLIPRSGGQC